ncbi:MAG: hypothetical protein FJ291_17240 [Planctomycetes bacterium]|nr:hypothetical protein [Planctomycetota bacterium]
MGRTATRPKRSATPAARAARSGSPQRVAAPASTGRMNSTRRFSGAAGSFGSSTRTRVSPRWWGDITR